MAKVRKLKSKGVDEFQKYLHSLVDNPCTPPPLELLTDSNFSEEVKGSPEIENKDFRSRMEIVSYLSQALETINHSTDIENKGLWSWLSLFYFDQICPEDDEGNRKPGRDYRHIVEIGYRYKHRHLLAGPFMVYKMYGAKGRLLLHGPAYQESRIFHEIVARQEFITNSGIIDAIDNLYFDEKREGPRVAVLSKVKPGTLLRFVDVVHQLELTYDLYSMGKLDILSLLPSEFDVWKASLPAEG